MTFPGSSRRADFLYGCAVFALLAAGFLVRSWGILPVPLAFWADEAWWATLLRTGEFVQFSFRPIGYMWLCSKLLVLGSPELTLRLPSLVAGCAALFCLYKSAEWSSRTRAAVLFVLVLAVFHPKLVVFSKEFKPYSLEVFVVSALTLWTLYCLRYGRGKAGLIAAALIASPFCYPVVFLYPGIALALAGERLAVLRRISARQWVYTALIAVPVIVCVHLYLFERLGAGPNRLLWGIKYDVFPLDTGLPGAIVWYVRKTWSLITLPGALEALPSFALPLFGIGYAGGIVVLVGGKRWRELSPLRGSARRDTRRECARLLALRRVPRKPLPDTREPARDRPGRRLARRREYARDGRRTACLPPCWLLRYRAAPRPIAPSGPCTGRPRRS